MGGRGQVLTKLLTRMQQFCTPSRFPVCRIAGSSVCTNHTMSNDKQVQDQCPWVARPDLRVPSALTFSCSTFKHTNNILEYICPTAAGNSSRGPISDNQNTNTKTYNFPSSQVKELFTSLPNGMKHNIEAPALDKVMQIEARTDLLIKHKRMKKHKLRKVRHKRYVMERKLKVVKEKKKKDKEERKLDEYRIWAQNFDAESVIMNDLEMARRGGFKADIISDLKKNMTS